MARKVLFVWTGITRCAGDCWRALASMPDIDLQIVIHARHDVALERDILHDLSYVIVSDETRLPSRLQRPDVLFAVGWHSPVVQHYVERRDWADVPKVFCFDMPWRTGLRCFAARFVLWRYLRRFDIAFVPGASGERYARWLGFRKIVCGFLAIDLARFSLPRQPGATGFVYVGRDAAEKRLDIIRTAYARYRELGGTWGIEFHHTTPYSELPALYASRACLVMASGHDPWPLVVLEALAAGCEAIVSDRCMNRLELPVHVTPYGDAEALAAEMLAVERGGKSTKIDLSFWDARHWVERVQGIISDLEAS